MRRWIALLLTLASLAGPALLAPAASADGGDDTAAVAVNTKDGTSIVRVAFAIVRVMDGQVDQSNAAVAYASCESCQAIAVSIQVVLVMTDPDVVAPTNVALAINDQCTACQTLASAYQFVFGTGGPVRFSPEGQRRIAEIRREFEELRRSGLSIEEIQARTDELADQLREVLRTELVPLGPPDDEDQPEEPVEPQQDETETSPSETRTETTPDETQTETTPSETQPETTPDETQTETTPGDTETTPEEGTTPPP
jgi:putative peptide zinc metalloprotease protein